MIPVILSGGSGSRLWPVSRQAYPKQFCHLLDETLFSKTLQRLLPFGKPWALTVKELKTLTDHDLKKLDLPYDNVIYEPYGRNTAAAIALLCRVLELRGLVDEVIGVFPADHLIGDAGAFTGAVQAGIEIAKQGEVVTLGIRPSFPATGYGYIETAGNFGTSRSARVAVAFHEKPDREKAEQFLAISGYYWNAGMFIFKTSTMIALFEKHNPDIWEAFHSLDAGLTNLDEIYKTVRSISIDYAIMEKLPSHVCIPCDFGWSDVGSWDAIAEISGSANPAAKQTIEVSAKDNYIVPHRDKTYALVEVDDLIVVDTADALMIVKRGASEKVKDVVEGLKKNPRMSSRNHVQEHPYEIRPWGRFEILRDTPEYKSKNITIDSGGQISYQSHNKREEHWIIIRGEGEVTLDGEITPVKPGQHIHIKRGTKHRIRNPNKSPLEFVEVQLGTYFGEDDIIRYEDIYGRNEPAKK